MSALGELAVQCAKRGWKLCIDGRYPAGRHEAGLVVDALEVRDRDHELLAHVPCDPLHLDTAAVDAACALQRQGLIAP